MTINSSTDICNLALDLLSAGTVTDIENPTDPTEALLNRWYDQARRKLLREHPWNFATKRIVLAASSTDPVFGYASAYPVPADFIRLLSISVPLIQDRDTILQSSEYQFENNLILITNNYTSSSSSLNLIYIYDNKTVSTYDPMFIDLLTYDIALSVAYKVTENNTNIQRIAEIQNRRRAMAMAIDGQERPPVRIERSRALSARHNRGSSTKAHRIIF